ncbi:MAG: SpoIIE family protein phosphatase [Spirulinaceae cyanobacterium RM2_2_10]|nr:SpoIIE family protein phosphatase [Spirulinaceae cyanobacterium RM2_2_10]
MGAPGGRVHCEPNHHLQKESRIGRVQSDGQFQIVHASDRLLKPLPWLGVEEQSFEAAPTVIELLREVSQCVQYSWELEQQSRRLEQTTARLRQEVAQRQQAEQALRRANAEIVALNRTLQEDNSRLQAELSVARQLQEMILPRPEELSMIPDLDIAGFMQAAEEVGGDYYDILQDGSRLITIGIGDVTGHGLESGILMLMTQTAVRVLRALQETDPVRSLNAINRVLYQNCLRMSSYRNLSLALLDYQDGKLHICGQHEEVIVMRAAGTVERIDTLDLGFPVGMLADISAFIAQLQIELAIGDGVVLYTDGITEAENSSRQLYGLERLIAVIQQHWSLSAQEIQTKIVADIRAFIGDRTVYDDITLVVLKRRI